LRDDKKGVFLLDRLKENADFLNQKNYLYYLNEKLFN